MVTLNATLLVELVLFLGFLWVLRRIVFRPLLALMDARTDKVTGDRVGAEADREAAERMKARYIDTLTRTNQEALQRLRHARLRAYQMNRVTLDELRTQSDAEVVSFREPVL